MSGWVDSILGMLGMGSDSKGASGASSPPPKARDMAGGFSDLGENPNEKSLMERLLDASRRQTTSQEDQSDEEWDNLSMWEKAAFLAKDSPPSPLGNLPALSANSQLPSFSNTPEQKRRQRSPLETDLMKLIGG